MGYSTKVMVTKCILIQTVTIFMYILRKAIYEIIQAYHNVILSVKTGFTVTATKSEGGNNQCNLLLFIDRSEADAI